MVFSPCTFRGFEYYLASIFCRTVRSSLTGNPGRDARLVCSRGEIPGYVRRNSTPHTGLKWNHIIRLIHQLMRRCAYIYLAFGEVDEYYCWWMNGNNDRGWRNRNMECWKWDKWSYVDWVVSIHQQDYHWDNHYALSDIFRRIVLYDRSIPMFSWLHCCDINQPIFVDRNVRGFAMVYLVRIMI